MSFTHLQLEWYELTLKAVAARISEERGVGISYEKVGLAIMELHNYSQNIQLFYHVLDNGLKVYHEIKDISFAEVIGEIELSDDECIYPENSRRNIFEKRVKAKGQIWELHKNDADPFPSNPHAHNYETGLKLDLSNGNLYKKKTITDSINKSRLLDLRKKFEKAGFTMPTLSV